MSSRPSSPGRSVLAEFRLIDQLRRRFGHKGARVVQGIGDDSAVVRPPSGQDLLYTSDLLAEGIHFRRNTITATDLGYKAAVANLSDIAAMGGTPEYILAAIAIPRDYNASTIVRIYSGLMQACRPYGVRLIGGDTSSSAGGMFLSIMVTGRIARGRALTRGGARVGDLIYVTGTLGDSLAGLQLLKDVSGTRRLSRAARAFLVARHRRPSPRIDTGKMLIRHRLASASIDLSDGLSGDLSHICTESAVGAEIEATSLPISPACRAFAEAKATTAAHLALQGGEDYELLFTVPPSAQTKVERLGRKADCRWTCIGVIRPHSFGLRLRTKDGMLRPVSVTSYRHFQSGRKRDREVPCSP